MRLPLRTLVLAVVAAGLPLFPAAAGAGQQSTQQIPAPVVRAQIAQVERALELERKALSEIGRNVRLARGSIDSASDVLGEVLRVMGGPSSFNAPSPNPALREARDADGRASQALENGNNAKAIKELTTAIRSKKRAIAQLKVVMQEAPPPAKPCDQEKDFQVFNVPAGSTGAWSEVYVHGVPRNARNISVRVIDRRTGRKPITPIFLGQKWSVQERGFRPDGTFAVRVTVTGRGIGPEGSRTANWKVIVTYDCP